MKLWTHACVYSLGINSDILCFVHVVVVYVCVCVWLCSWMCVCVSHSIYSNNSSNRWERESKLVRPRPLTHQWQHRDCGDNTAETSELSSQQALDNTTFNTHISLRYVFSAEEQQPVTKLLQHSSRRLPSGSTGLSDWGHSTSPHTKMNKRRHELPFGTLLLVLLVWLLAWQYTPPNTQRSVSNGSTREAMTSLHCDDCVTRCGRALLGLRLIFSLSRGRKSNSWLRVSSRPPGPPDPNCAENSGRGCALK